MTRLSTDAGASDLIETYWNVNEVEDEVNMELPPDLIETYWNVNITDNWYRLYAKPI